MIKLLLTSPNNGYTIYLGSSLADTTADTGTLKSNDSFNKFEIDNPLPIFKIQIKSGNVFKPIKPINLFLKILFKFKIELVSFLEDKFKNLFSKFHNLL